jgi:hypothetical protein
MNYFSVCDGIGAAHAALLWLACVLLVILIVKQFPALTVRPSSIESQVRQWASDYPGDLRNRWAWCYLDSAEHWSTDQKLREDVRLKSVQVLTDTERQTLIPLDDKIAEAVPKQTTPLKETYLAVGNGLKVAEWNPPPEMTPPKPPPVPTPKPNPPERRRIFRR